MPHLEIKERTEVLSPRETEVLRLFAMGKTSLECAGLLNLSYHTLEAHRKSIHKKLHSRNIVEAIEMARNKKLI